MPLMVYNSQTRAKEEFHPLTPGKVLMYVCGVTVYDDPHIGHARCYVAFDAINRHFRSKGWDVTYIRNFTDIDDKIIRRAQETGRDWKELAQSYIDSFRQDMDALGLIPPTLEPRATEHIDGMIAAIQKLVEKGHAYQVEGGDVLFSVDSFPAYGKLSGRDLCDLRCGARVEVDSRKKGPFDFVLWKAAKPGEPAWDSPFGAGRPGWHIECSVMSAKYLGITFDIHGGGEDLVFPHHENEMAQSEALNEAPFANYWIHNGFVQVNQEKMSKSLGNFFTIKDILRKVKPETLRFFLLSKHYRSPLDFSDQALVEAGQALDRLYTALLAAREEVDEPVSQVIKDGPERVTFEEIGKVVGEFEAGMDDDFNTARALGALFSLVRISNRLLGEKKEPARDALIALCAARMKDLGARLGLLRQDPAEFLQSQASGVGDGIDPAEVDSLIEQRAAARRGKNFAEADRIRDALTAMGVILEDTPQGTRWRVEG